MQGVGGFRCGPTCASAVPAIRAVQGAACLLRNEENRTVSRFNKDGVSSTAQRRSVS